MKPNDRQKMCPNCDGRIPHEATQCPYCFANLPSLPDGNQGTLFSLQDSLYTPPYRNATPEEKKPAPKTETAAPTSMAATAKSPEMAQETAGFWPILLLTLGANLFTLGILQFFFSDEGAVRLEIQSGYWFLFVLLSLPLFYFGYRKAAGLK